MRTRWVVVLLAMVAVFVVGVTAIVGYFVEPEPPVIVAEKGLIPYYFSEGFNWELAALSLAGLGTLTLAIATGTLAASTWQDVRASQRMAEASVEANRLVRTDQGGDRGSRSPGTPRKASPSRRNHASACVFASTTRRTCGRLRVRACFSTDVSSRTARAPSSAPPRSPGWV